MSSHFTGIHGVHNHRKGWSTARAQVLYHLNNLLTYQLFELIGTLVHIVTPAEEEVPNGTTEENSAAG